MQRDAIDFKNDKVSTLFRKLLIPTLLGTLALSAMTAIDGIVIGHGVGAEGVAAVNIIVPVYQIVSGLCLMVGAGCSVVTSIHLSKGKVKVARLNVTQALLFTFIVVSMLCIAMGISIDGTARMLGASETLLPQVHDYLLWMFPGFIMEIFTMIGLFIVRLDGSPKYAMWSNIIPAFCNIFLDWLFVFPLGMGVKGAAIATSISLGVGAMMTLVYLLFFATTLKLIPLKLSRNSIKLSIRNVGYQCKIGSSSLFGELTMAVMIFTGNIVFMRLLGDDGVGAFGIACYYAPFFFMIGNAVAQSAQPIISFNYGIGDTSRIRQAVRLLFSTAFAIGVFVTMLFIFAPHWLVGLFVDTSSNAGQIAMAGFPYFAAGVICFIMNVAIIGYYQSIERMKRANTLVFLRGFALLVPSYLVLPIFLGVEGAWLSMPLTEILTISVAGLLALRKHPDAIA